MTTRLLGRAGILPRLCGEAKLVRPLENLNMNRSDYLYIGEDNLVVWEGLQDAKTGAYVNDATLTWALLDRRGNEIASGNLTYNADPDWRTDDTIDGCYDGNIEEDVKISSGETYYIELTATASGDRIGHRRLKKQAGYHGRL